MDWLSGRKRKLEPQTVFSVLLDLSSSSVTWEQTGVLLLRSSGCSGGLFLPKAETLCFDMGIYRERLRAKCVPVTVKVSRCLFTEPPLFRRNLLLGFIVMEKQTEKLSAKILVWHLKAERTSILSMLGFVMDKFPLRQSGRLS